MVVEVMTTHELSQRRACGLIGITRRGLKCAPAEDRNRGLRQRILMVWTQPSLFSTASEWARMVANHHDEERGRIQDEG
jgi:hypothetical protein